MNQDHEAILNVISFMLNNFVLNTLFFIIIIGLISIFAKSFRPVLMILLIAGSAVSIISNHSFTVSDSNLTTINKIKIENYKKDYKSMNLYELLLREQLINSLKDNKITSFEFNKIQILSSYDGVILKDSPPLTEEEVKKAEEMAQSYISLFPERFSLSKEDKNMDIVEPKDVSATIPSKNIVEDTTK